MERIARAQALGDHSRAKFMRGQRSLEINPRHPLVKELRAKVGGCGWVGGWVGECPKATPLPCLLARLTLGAPPPTPPAWSVCAV